MPISMQQPAGDGESITPQTAIAMARMGITDEASLRRLWEMRDQVDKMMRFADQKTQYYDEWGEAFVALDHAIEEALARMTTGQRSRGALAESAGRPSVAPPPMAPPPPVARALAAAPQPPPQAPEQPTTPWGGLGVLPRTHESPPGSLIGMGPSMYPRNFIPSDVGPLAVSTPRATPPPMPMPNPAQPGILEAIRALLFSRNASAPGIMPSGAVSPNNPLPGGPMVPTMTRPSSPPVIPMSSPDYGRASENMQAATVLPQTPGGVPDWLRRLFGASAR